MEAAALEVWTEHDANHLVEAVLRGIETTHLEPRCVFALGKLKPEDIPRILDSGDRCLAGPTVPPQGLYMTDVRYPGAAGRLMEG